ncbi:MAG: MFS transporter [Syntrophorhabdaceae bacterium]
MHYAWIIALTGTLVVLLAHGFGRMSYSVLLPAMRDGLHFSYTQLGLIGTGNFIGYLSLSIVGGFLAARFGVRRVVFVSLIILGISIFLTGFTNSFVYAFATRLVTGLGNGGAFVPIMALPAAWFAAKKRGLATGIVTMGVGMGLSLSGIILPFFLSKYGVQGWRYAWFCMGAMASILSLICYFLLRDNPREKGLGVYGAPISDGGEEPKKEPTPSMFSAFKDVIGNSELWKLGSVYMMYGFSYIIYLTFIVAYLGKEVGIGASRAGQIFAFLGFVSIFCGVFWGGISDKVGRRYGSFLAYLTLTIAYAILVFSKSTTGFYISASLFGITAFAVPVIMAAAAGDAVGGKLAPAALGFITLFFGIGQAFGPFIGGLIKDLTGSFTNAFLISAIVSLIGTFGSLVLRKKLRTSAA